MTFYDIVRMTSDNFLYFDIFFADMLSVALPTILHVTPSKESLRNVNILKITHLYNLVPFTDLLILRHLCKVNKQVQIFT
jgi:hypothetical protein